MSTNIAECLFLSSYGRLMVPVTSPSAVAAKPDKQNVMGKAPGVLRNGKAVTIDLRQISCKTLAQAQEWDRWCWNVGLACGRDIGDGTAVFAFDNDVDDAAVAWAQLAELRALCELTGEALPIRMVKAANYHRFLFIVRLRLADMPAGYRESYTHPDGRSLAVDGLWTGKQFVAAGTHQRTLAPFAWLPELPPGGPGGIPLWSIATLDAVRKALERPVLAAGYRSTASTASGLLGGSGTRSAVQASEADVRAVMALLPNSDQDHFFDSRERWIGVGHGLYVASGGAPWGLDLWQDFNGQRAQTESPAALWEQFDKNPPKTAGFASLTQYAAQASGAAKAAAILLPDTLLEPDDAAALDAKDAETRQQQEEPWREVTARWAYITGERGYADLRDPDAALISPKEMEQQFKPRMAALRQLFIDHKIFGPKDRPSFGDCFRHAPNALVLEQRAYFPGKPRVFRHPDRLSTRWLNTWTAPKFKPEAVPKSRVKPWLEFARYVWGSSYNAELFRAFCALAFQDWSTRPSWAPLLRTKPGIGKNLMLAPLLEALGERHVAQPEMSALFGRFKTHLQARLVLVSETHALHGHGHTGRHDMNALKEQIAGAKMIAVERKGRDIVMVPALACFIFLANDDDALTLGRDDRRFWIVVNLIMARAAEFYAEMAAWNADPANVEALGQYHARLQIPDAVRAILMAPAPQTDARQELIMTTADPVTMALVELVEDIRTAGDARMVQTPAQIVAALLDSRALSSREKAGLATGVRFNTMLLSIGARPVKPAPNGKSAEPIKMPGNDKAGRYWLLAPNDTQGRDWAGLSVMELAAASRDGWPRQAGTAATVTELPTRPASRPETSTDDAEIV